MLTAVNVTKSYTRHTTTVPVLRGVDLAVAAGEFLGIVGASGCGKSTLLHLLGLLDRPDSGSIVLDGVRIDDLPHRRRERHRNSTFGFVFQFYHLLPELSARDNVLLPGLIRHSLWGWLSVGRQARARADELLERVGLSHRRDHKPRELSGGEMQRAAIARALFNQPRVLLADEPTGNLDEQSGGDIIRLLRDLNRDDGLTIVMVTHNPELAASTDRQVRLTAGRVEPANQPVIRLLSPAS